MPTVLDVRSEHRAWLGTFSQFRPFNSFPFFPTCIFLVVDSVSKLCLSSTRPKPATAPLPPRFWSAFQPRQAHVQLPHLSPSRTQNLEFPRNNRCKSFLPDVCRVRGMQLILPDVCRVRICRSSVLSLSLPASCITAAPSFPGTQINGKPIGKPTYVKLHHHLSLPPYHPINKKTRDATATYLVKKNRPHDIIPRCS